MATFSSVDFLRIDSIDVNVTGVTSTQTLYTVASGEYIELELYNYDVTLNSSDGLTGMTIRFEDSGSDELMIFGSVGGFGGPSSATYQRSSTDQSLKYLLTEGDKIVIRRDGSTVNIDMTLRARAKVYST